MLSVLCFQAAHFFADLHDTPGRLVARGLVHGCVEWRSSRAFFFTRLARRLLEQEAVDLLRRAHNPTFLGHRSAPPRESLQQIEKFEVYGETGQL